MNIINLTRSLSTPEQKDAGVVDLPDDAVEFLMEALTFEAPPSGAEVQTRARAIADLAKIHGFKYAMIGGANFLMSALERELRRRGITPLYSFSRREVVEETQKDMTVKKISKFRHVGFIKSIEWTK